MDSQKKQNILHSILVHVLLVLVGVTFFLPFYWLLSTSLKNDTQLFQFPPVWFPWPLKWDNYPTALSYIPFLTYVKNTLIISFLTVLGTVVSCSLVAYSFARIPWKGRNFFFLVLLSTMMIPYQVTLIPVLIIFKHLGWVGTIKPLVVPAFFGSAFYVFLLRQFFMSIPKELSDAARIDGCSEFGIYWRIMLPLSRPAMATVILFTFIGSWNDFLGPLIYLSDESQYTLSLGLQQFLSQHGAEWSLLMAASTVMILPIVVLFFFTQRTFIQGIALTGIKG